MCSINGKWKGDAEYKLPIKHALPHTTPFYLGRNELYSFEYYSRIFRSWKIPHRNLRCTFQTLKFKFKFLCLKLGYFFKALEIVFEGLIICKHMNLTLYFWKRVEKGFLSLSKMYHAGWKIHWRSCCWQWITIWLIG